MRQDVPETVRPGPLTGYVVIDLTSMVMGPMATQILGDMGATVIKVERPEGDPQRRPRPSRHPTMNGVFLNLNRNKQSLAIDLKRREAQQAVLRLCEKADVVVASMQRETAAKLGLDYDAVRAVKPDIVYCSANGFGEAGPLRAKPAYDDVIQAASGIAGLMQQRTGSADYMPIALCDKVSGLTMAYAILGALLHRERTGEGQYVETPMFETSVAFNLVEHVCGFVFDPPEGEFGWKRILSPFRRPFRTADGFACIMPYSDRNWSDFFAEIGRPDLAAEPRFATHPRRIDNIDELYGMIAEHSPTRDTATWMAFCDRVAIPAMPVISPTDLWEHEQVLASKLLGFAEHPTEGRYRTIGSPVVYSQTPMAVRKHAPNIGEDSRAVLLAAGLGAEEVDRLVSGGVVTAFEPDDPSARKDVP